MVDLLFYASAGLAVLCALGVVLMRNPVHSVLSLLGSFAGLSVCYLLAGFAFLAAIQILVYGGAVMVLFLFVVMLLNLGDPGTQDDEPLFHPGPRSAAGLGLAAFALVLLSGSIVFSELAAPTLGFALPADGLDPLQGLAEAMFTRYALPFEAASVLLLATAVGVLVLAKRERRGAPARPAAPAVEATEAPREVQA